MDVVMSETFSGRIGFDREPLGLKCGCCGHQQRREPGCAADNHESPNLSPSQHSGARWEPHGRRATRRGAAHFIPSRRQVIVPPPQNMLVGDQRFQWVLVFFVLLKVHNDEARGSCANRLGFGKTCGRVLGVHRSGSFHTRSAASDYPASTLRMAVCCFTVGAAAECPSM